MSEKTLDIDESLFTTIPCDKCGSSASYTNPEEVTECFGCKCKRLHEMEIKCECGWTGSYFDQECQADIAAPRLCPGCKKEGYNE